MRPKLAVCWIWSSPFVWTRFTESALQLQRPDGYDVQFFRGDGWCPAKRHLNACQKAVAWGADLICILGSDQTYDADLLPRLIARWDEHHEPIAAMVPVRGYVDWQGMKPFQPMAWRLKSSEAYREYRGQDLDGDMIELIDPADGDVQECHFIGSGVLLLHRDHLLALKMPWFYESVDHATQQRIACMDSKFVWRLQQEGGGRIMVDTTIKVKHIHAFEIDETFQDRFEDWQQPGHGDPAICRYTELKPAAAGV